MQSSRQSSVGKSSDVAALRAFNRLYTGRLGLLQNRLDGSPFTLTQARVLYELAHRSHPTAAEIARALKLDRAQLSRLLKGLVRTGLVRGEVSPDHAKHRLLALTPAGETAFESLNAASQSAVAAFLDELPSSRRRRLLAAAKTMAEVMDPSAKTRPHNVRLRPHRPGDLGWVIHRQAALYAEEYGWDCTYEALIAEILAQFVRSFDPAREQAWLADLDGTTVGSIFLMKSADPATARLRLLYVEPTARGLGIGRLLVDACIERARAIGFQRLELWTNSVLVSARRIYEATGFELIDESPHRSFGRDLVGQTWALDLRTSGAN